MTNTDTPGDSRATGIKEAIQSIVDYIDREELKDIMLAGHSYSGMIITRVADAIPNTIHWHVCWNAFVPNDGDAISDLSPPHYGEAFSKLAAASPDNSVMLPYLLWREIFMNDADEALAKRPSLPSMHIPMRLFLTRSPLNPIPLQGKWENPT